MFQKFADCSELSSLPSNVQVSNNFVYYEGFWDQLCTGIAASHIYAVWTQQWSLASPSHGKHPFIVIVHFMSQCAKFVILGSGTPNWRLSGNTISLHWVARNWQTPFCWWPDWDDRPADEDSDENWQSSHYSDVQVRKSTICVLPIFSKWINNYCSIRTGCMATNPRCSCLLWCHFQSYLPRD